MVRNMIPVSRLVKARRKAKRRKVWFTVLSRVEKDIVNLTITCVDVIRSPKLAKIVTAIIIKLEKALESPIERMVRTLGCLTAQKLIRIAQDWGNKLAHWWNQDGKFARYLTVMQIRS